jgi:hypothetical protein
MWYDLKYIEAKPFVIRLSIFHEAAEMRLAVK